jgi:hypothetical protein
MILTVSGVTEFAAGSLQQLVHLAEARVARVA